MVVMPCTLVSGAFRSQHVSSSLNSLKGMYIYIRIYTCISIYMYIYIGDCIGDNYRGCSGGY